MSHEAIPSGWKLVPVEPTEEMLAAADAGDREYTLRSFGDVMTVQQSPYDHWYAMIAAAPQAPTGQQADEVRILRKQVSSYKTLVRCLEEQRDHLREGAQKAAEARATLESERQANAILTEELAALTGQQANPPKEQKCKE